MSKYDLKHLGGPWVLRTTNAIEASKRKLRGEVYVGVTTESRVWQTSPTPSEVLGWDSKASAMEAINSFNSREPIKGLGQRWRFDFEPVYLYEGVPFSGVAHVQESGDGGVIISGVLGGPTKAMEETITVTPFRGGNWYLRTTNAKADLEFPTEWYVGSDGTYLRGSEYVHLLPGMTYGAETPEEALAWVAEDRQILGLGKVSTFRFEPVEIVTTLTVRTQA